MKTYYSSFTDVLQEERTSQKFCSNPVTKPRRQLKSPASHTPILTVKPWCICFLFVKMHKLSMSHKIQTKLRLASQLNFQGPSCQNLWNFKMGESGPYVSIDFGWGLTQNLRPYESLKFLRYFVYGLQFWFNSYIEMVIFSRYPSPLLFVSPGKKFHFCVLSSNPPCYWCGFVGWSVLSRKSHSVGFQNWFTIQSPSLFFISYLL